MDIVRGMYVLLVPRLSAIVMLAAVALHRYVIVPVESTAVPLKTLYVPNATDVAEMVHDGLCAALSEALTMPASTPIATSTRDGITAGRPRRDMGGCRA